MLLRAGSVRAEDLERHRAGQGRRDLLHDRRVGRSRADLVIWMDGRPHPSKYAEHTRGGFTTGRWEGDTLVAYTTHMKAGFLRKNGPPSSDQATMTSRFWRHGDILTVLAVVEDPDLPGRAAHRDQELSALHGADAAGRSAVRDDLRRQASRRQRPALRAGEESVRRRADEAVSPADGRRCWAKSRRCIRSTGRRSRRRTCRSSPARRDCGAAAGAITTYERRDRRDRRGSGFQTTKTLCDLRDLCVTDLTSSSRSPCPAAIPARIRTSRS